MWLQIKHIKHIALLLLAVLTAVRTQGEICLDATQYIGAAAEFNSDTQFTPGSQLFNVEEIKFIKPFSSAQAGTSNTYFTKFLSITNAGISYQGYLTMDLSQSPFNCHTLKLNAYAERIIIDGDSIAIDGGLNNPLNTGKGWVIHHSNNEFRVSGNFHRVVLAGANVDLMGVCLDKCEAQVECLTDFEYEIRDEGVAFINTSDFLVGPADTLFWSFEDGTELNEDQPVVELAADTHKVCMHIERIGCANSFNSVCYDVIVPPMEECEVEFSFEVDQNTVSFKNESSIDADWARDFAWDLGDGTTSTENDPVHNYDVGVYEVCLKIGSDECAVAETQKKCEEVVVSGCKIGHNSITPDNDGNADFVYVQAGSSIYDRSGYLIMKVEEDINWDGVDATGAALPMGYYTVVCPEGKKYNITIIR